MADKGCEGRLSLLAHILRLNSYSLLTCVPQMIEKTAMDGIEQRFPQHLLDRDLLKYPKMKFKVRCCVRATLWTRLNRAMICFGQATEPTPCCMFPSTILGYTVAVCHTEKERRQ